MRDLVLISKSELMSKAYCTVEIQGKDLPYFDFKAVEELLDKATPVSGEAIGEMLDNGVTWYKQNPHAYPVGTKFYASPQPAEQYEYIGTVNGIGQVVITLQQDGKVKVGEKLYRLNEAMKG